MKRRRNQSDRDRERREREQQAWDEFMPRLAALQTYEEAMSLALQTPPPDAPGRKFYSNLRFFLAGFTVPFGSGQIERSLYATFIRRLEARGELKRGYAPQILEALAPTS